MLWCGLSFRYKVAIFYKFSNLEKKYEYSWNLTKKIAGLKIIILTLVKCIRWINFSLWGRIR